MAYLAGQTLTAASLNLLAIAVDPPIAKLRQTSAQTIGTASFTALNFDAEDEDSASGHDNVTNNSRYTAQVAGWYEVSGGVTFAGNATGRRLARIHKNGALIDGSVSGVPANAAVISFAVRPTIVELGVGDYVEIAVYQDSGGNLATFITNSEYQSTMIVKWVSN